MTNKMKKSTLYVLIALFMTSVLCFSFLTFSKVNAENAPLNYGVISTSIQTDTTLKYIAGWEGTADDTIKQTEFETNKTMPNENDGSAVSGGYAVYIHPLYATVSNNAIVFDTPISAEDMLKSGGLTIRIYVALSTSDTFMIRELPSDFSYGVYFYGLGATGSFSDHPVWLPAEIKQNEYVDFKINAYDASRLADASGYIKGLAVATRIGGWSGMSTDNFYFVSPDPYIYIKSISFNAPDTTLAQAGEMKIYAGMGGLTHVNGYINDGNPSGGYNKYYDGYMPVDVVPGYRDYEQIDQLELDNGQTVDKAYRFTYHFSSVANVAKNSILFERPLTVADIENTNGITLRIFAHLTSDGSDYTRFNETYGLFFYGYGQGITGESDDVGVVIPANAAKDQWTDLYIPADVLKTMVGDNGVLYGLNYGTRIDVVSDAMYKGNTATNPGYVLLNKVTLEEKRNPPLETELKNDNTLQYVYGLSPQIANSHNTSSQIEWITESIPLENNNSTVFGAYRVYIHPFYAQVQSNAIAFKTPISVEDMKNSNGLTIRMYVDVSASDLFYVQSRVSDYGYGIYIYGLGATGGYDDNPVWVPADITQREWIDFKINAYDASRLADSSGTIKGITFASFIKNNELGGFAENFYTADPNPYIYISSISFTEEESNVVKTGVLKTYTGMSNLTHVQGKPKNVEAAETEYGDAYHDYQQGLLPIDIVPGPRLHHAITSLPDNNGMPVEKAYRLSLHSGTVAVAKHSILFDTPLKLDDIRNSGGLSLRIYTHLTEGGVPYLVRGLGFGIFIYGYGDGITGASADSSILIPEGVVQDDWSEFFISVEQAESLAGKDGVLYGLQYGLHVEVGQASQLFIGSAYSNPGYILISSITLLEKGHYADKTITYKLYDGVEKTATFAANRPLSNYNVYPERAGYLFCGWYEGDNTFDKLFDFSSILTEDVVVTARWAKVDLDITKYTGLYTDGNARIVVYADGTIDASSVINYYDDIGISDGVLYATAPGVLYSYDLSQMDKSEFNIVSYYSFGKLVKKVAVGKSETVEEFSIDIEGFTLNGWKEGSLQGQIFEFGKGINADVSLYAYATPIEVADSKYAQYLGTYYNSITAQTIVLSENNVATYGQQTLNYYVLEDGKFAFENVGEFIVGNANGSTLEINEDIFVKLTKYYVTFDCGDNEPFTVEVSGGDYKVALPETPVRNGCVFVRWETIDGFEYDFDSVVYKSITLYGVWKLEDRKPTTTNEEDGGCSSMVSSNYIAVVSALTIAGVAIVLRRKKNA